MMTTANGGCNVGNNDDDDTNSGRGTKEEIWRIDNASLQWWWLVAVAIES